MYSFDEIKFKKGFFYGIISSNFIIKDSCFINKFINKFVKNKGAFIYISPKYKDKIIKEYLKINFDNVLKKEQVVFMDLEKDEYLRINETIKKYKNQIKKLKQKGYKDIIICTKNDLVSSNYINDGSLCKFYNELKRMTRDENIMFAINYTYSDLKQKDFLDVICLHDIFVLENQDGLNTYNCIDFIKSGLVNKLYKSARTEYQNELKKIESLKTLGELSQGIAHDFNNLLTAIIGFSQISLLKESKAEVKEYLDIIHKTALDGKAIVDKVKNFVKGNYNSKKSVHKVNDIVKSSIDMAKYRLKNYRDINGVHIELVEELNSNSCIYCNEYEVRQAILNIILNAIDSMEKEGTLTVKTNDKIGTICIEIEDTGIGMDNNTKEKIFEPFFTTKGTKGTGLGLSLVKKVVESYGGQIKVQSKLNKGTKFIINLSENIKEQIYAAESVEFYSEKKTKILVVDDKISVARSISELLSLLDVQADIETETEKILDRFSKENYDMIICDFSMPYKNGVEISKDIKRNYPRKPFILLTGWSQDTIKDSLETVDYVLQKPCTLDELSKVINKMLNNIDSKKKGSYNVD